MTIKAPVFGAMLAATPFLAAAAKDCDPSNTQACYGYSSIPECLDEAQFAAHDDGVDDAKKACSNIESTDPDVVESVKTPSKAHGTDEACQHSMS